ncbi:hypothetical protein b2560 [Escherichia coli K-12]|nr:hypothetical protein b2560 [Escherichia coli K-12]
MATHERRVVFFDLDGTLHQQDMFGSFLRYLLRRQPLNALLVLPLLPIIAIVDSICQCNTPFNFLCCKCSSHSKNLRNPMFSHNCCVDQLNLQLRYKGRAARWPMSLLLWGCTFGHSEARLQTLQADFVRWFRDNVTAFPLVQERLTTYLLSSDADIWLITGSPQPLVEAVYFDTPWLPRVNLIASQIQRGYGGWVLTMRCLGHEKVAQLERKIGTPLRLYSGYSDSNQDNPLLYFCQHRWRVTPRGELQQLE